LPEQLKQVSARSWLNVTLTVQTPSVDGFGMHGSGMFIMNPPWLLENVLRDTMPYLAKVLGKAGEGCFSLEFEETSRT
jgi:23S rRNA (adenine2030-N6)-methyltransferase